MDVFRLRDEVIDEYADFVRSFVRIQDDAIRAHVERELEDGTLWPEPLVQLNPAFAPGGSVDELVAAGKLHGGCERIFRRNKSETDPHGKLLRLHLHQVEALELARQGLDYVLTTGTGSGKSLSYIVPIVDHVLRRGSGRGTQAIVVYPMNALANSQLGELQKFLQHGYPEGKPPVTFARFTGQEDDDERTRIKESPPDILLTNYVMLELLLTRPHDRQVIDHARGPRFLVLDELHTYRGRQGSDVAMLVRRVRERTSAPGERLQVVGTSATMASGGTWPSQRAEVARVASLLFGAPVDAGHVVGETLRRATEGAAPSSEELRASVSRPPAADQPASFLQDPLARWIGSRWASSRTPMAGSFARSRGASVGRRAPPGSWRKRPDSSRARPRKPCAPASCSAARFATRRPASRCSRSASTRERRREERNHDDLLRR